MEVANIQAYYTTELITADTNFIVQARPKVEKGF